MDGNLASTQLSVTNGTLNVTLSGAATISAGDERDEQFDDQRQRDGHQCDVSEPDLSRDGQL